LTSVSQLPAMRAFLMDTKRGLIQCIASEVASANTVRRIGVLRAMRNCCFDEEHAVAIASDHAKGGLLWLLIHPIVGHPSQFKSHELAGLPSLVAPLVAAGAKRDLTLDVGECVMEALTLCARIKAARLQLKSINLYPIVREYHESIRGKAGFDHVEQNIEDLVPLLVLDEEPEPVVTTASTAVSGVENASIAVSQSSDKVASKEQ